MNETYKPIGRMVIPGKPEKVDRSRLFGDTESDIIFEITRYERRLPDMARHVLSEGEGFLILLIINICM